MKFAPMKRLILVLSLLLVGSGCSTTYNLIGASRDLPAGKILVASDLEPIPDTHDKHWLWTTPDRIPVTDDASRLVGRKLKRAVAKDQVIHAKDLNVAGLEWKDGKGWVKKGQPIKD